MDEIEPEEFRQARRTLFEALEGMSSITDHVAFQVRLAGEILSGEKLRPLLKNNKPRRLILKDHLRRLHSYGDALAWTLLHPHAIRNLAKNDGCPPWLSNQEPALVHALETIKKLSEEGTPGIVCDLTNVLRIGDVVFGDPEVPSIIELKSSATPDHRKYLGRAGRQRSRMEGTTKYLAEGQAQVYGESHTRVVLESDHEAQYNWGAVQEVIDRANKDGAATLMLSDYQLLFARRFDSDTELPDQASLDQFASRTIMVGALSRVLEEI